MSNQGEGSSGGEKSREKFLTLIARISKIRYNGAPLLYQDGDFFLAKSLAY
ncbi:MAG: hypothetical protein BroJett011_69680 [Chloroflexota bacterium]|nr:MAG: hypothetical protein BroJett011_69680 [Chloroflexota bacterium]